MLNREEELYRCQLAEQTGRYDDMVTSMKKIIESNVQLDNEERNYFLIAYRNLISTCFLSWQIISNIEQQTQANENQQRIIKEYRERIEREVKDICYEVLMLLDKYLVPKAMSVESKIFYSKMTQSYYRNLAQVVVEDERQKMIEQMHFYNNETFDIIKNQLPPTHPMRLSHALNYAVFLYDMLNEPKRAYDLAKQTFDDALADLDSIDEDSYKDSMLIMQLLRDNIAMWSSEMSDLDGIND